MLLEPSGNGLNEVVATSRLASRFQIMDAKVALAKVAASLQEGAELRMKVARDNAHAIVEAASMITDCLRSGGKLLLFGNGGSAADAQHLAAEFVGRFVGERR